MQRHRFFAPVLVTVACVILTAGLSAATPVGTSMTYQGELKQAGAPFTGATDLAFSLWNAASGGEQIGPTQFAAGLAIAEGRFTVMLDFGALAFAGEARWLQISVNGLLLTPRQTITAAPYALHSLTGNPGPPGPQGESGPPGSPGPDGVVTGASTSSGGLAMTGSFNFLTSPVTVTISDGDAIFVVAMRALGSTSVSGATQLEIAPGYRDTAGGGVIVWGTPATGLLCASNDRRVFTVNGVIAGLPAGTYEVGMVGRQGPGGNGSWNNNSAGQASALVFSP